MWPILTLAHPKSHSPEPNELMLGSLRYCSSLSFYNKSWKNKAFTANTFSTSISNEQDQIKIFTLIFPRLTILGKYKTNGQQEGVDKPQAVAPKTL